MSEKNTLNCKCGAKVEQKYAEKDKKFFYYCDKCKVGGKGKTEGEATEDFLKALQKTGDGSAPPEEYTPFEIELIPPPKSAKELTTWAKSNMPALINSSAKFIDRPATQRMIEKNIKYIMTTDLKDAWNTPEGQESIVDAMIEACEIGASMPEMGCIVPFGKSVTFIPDYQAYNHALTKGAGAPFKNISINCIHENDIYELARDDGNFSFKISKIGMPRGDVIGVAVQAEDIESGKIIGEAYDEKHLMGKVERHSKAYKYYIADMLALRKAEAEGKDHIIKWGDKKIYEKDIQSPYAGADKPEMLKKVAAKSFFRPYMKTRNARAMADELKEDTQGNTQAGGSPQPQPINYEKIIEKSFNNIKDAELKEEEAGI